MMILWVMITSLGRLIIHAPNATPTTSLALLAPLFFPLYRTFILMIFSLILSDLLLHFLFHYPAVGSWSFFTYSGWMLTIYLGYLFGKKNLSRLLSLSLISSLTFWIWTNFGTWCSTNLYPHTLSGLVMCYFSAIPFLRNSIISGLIWTMVFFQTIIKNSNFSRSLALSFLSDTLLL